ncbi:TolB family protein [Alkalitalea saponilacus]|uniref:Oligogalacturonide lyase n=1 Tax=Alkalitalea saponilacus TaxID=889453 RepID=A0A1T5HST0_9BACT|nr:hypothetical protein [Alkalitalea saponilacus]SKC23581.1 oligogalacturonide lyase [Alkalitalea saponilacus]
MKAIPPCQLFLVPLIFFLTGMGQLQSQIGTRFPSEKKVIDDPITGHQLIFLTSASHGDRKIYPTHPQWTADGNWLIFMSNRVRGELIAVNERSGDMVQITEGGFVGTPLIGWSSMHIYVMRRAAPQQSRGQNTAMNIIKIDLDMLFRDSEKGQIQPKENYEDILGQIPSTIGAHGDMALDANEEYIYFRTSREEAEKHLPPGTNVEQNFGPRNMGAGPGGIGKINLLTGKSAHVISVPFQVGHIQTNPWIPGEIVFCWETGGKSPQRTWTVRGDGTGLRPLYPEADYEWVTHEAIITKDEVAMAIMGHRPVKISDELKEIDSDPENPGQEVAWGPSGTREKPTGLAIVNIRTREMRIEAQTNSGSGFWHVHGSSDGRWAVGDDFSRSIYLVDRTSREMMMISTGHKTTARDHPHPTFSPCGTKFQIQSAMLSEDDRSMNICVIHVPEEWLNRTYENHFIPK